MGGIRWYQWSCCNATVSSLMPPVERFWARTRAPLCQPHATALDGGLS